MNPVALITGASRGIGRGIALELAKGGIDLVINYAGNVAAAKQTSADCISVGAAASKTVRAEICQADIAKAEDRQRLIQFVREKFGRIDLLVNNAGVAPEIRADILEASEASFDRLMNINAKGPYFLTQSVAKWMIEQCRAGGSSTGTAPKIITISSISAYTASVNRGDYCISKAALSMLTPLFASRLADHGINVYEIRPGVIATDMTGPVKEKYDKLIAEGLTPIKRWGAPEDVGRAVAAVALGAFPFSTGEVINVDGGFTCEDCNSMAIKIHNGLTAKKLLPKINRIFELSAAKILNLQKNRNPGKGTPVFTVKGKYTSRGWTEWTQGFQFGSALLQFDATGEREFLELGRKNTVAFMATHVSHIGVHDHGFNNISTYGNLWRLMREGKLPFNESEKNFYELALKVSGAVQAARWTAIGPGQGYIYSFNGPHSLFVDTMRSLRSLAVAHQLGHVLMGERDQKISLLDRLIQHAETTANYSIYYGRGRDVFDVRGRTAHESIFNLNDGSYRCPNSQQGYSPFSTWTRGLAWAILGYAEQLEYLETIRENKTRGIVSAAKRTFLRAALATADFYLENCCQDGIPMWDTGAPDLHRLGNYLAEISNPFNSWEPVDSSAAAIAGQGLFRLGKFLSVHGEKAKARRYLQAALTVASTLFDDPYLSNDVKHQGLLLHSVYHRPNGWDYVPAGQKVPNGESSMWGDYHARELGLLLLREAQSSNYLTFFNQS